MNNERPVGNSAIIRGKWFMFEGGECTGKSGLIALLKKLLNPSHCVFTREPGGTEFGEFMRQKTFEYKGVISNLATAQAMYTARIETMDKVILPALTKGQHVFSDRGHLSTFAYQGGEGDWHTLINMDPWIMGKKYDNDGVLIRKPRYPDRTFFIDVPPDVELERVIKRGKENSYDSIDIEEITARYKRYLKAISFFGEARVYSTDIIDGTKPEEIVQQEIVATIMQDIGIATAPQKGENK